MTLRRRTARDDEARAKGLLDGAVAALRNCQRAGLATIAVADMLTMLGAAPEAAAAAPARDPLADPLTGCRPAAAPR